MGHIKLILFFFFVFYFHNKSSGNYALTGDTAGYKSRHKIIVGRIEVCGNKVTREKIITRELIFHSNDTLYISELEDRLLKSKHNLLNTSLFNFVTITYELRDSLFADVSISVLERWYVWPVPIAELSFRNFNSWLQQEDLSKVNYGINLTNNNFRGRKESLNLLLRFGYDELYSLSYQVPYINSKQTVGLGFTIGVTRGREVAYETVDNKLVYYKNHVKYPLEKTIASVQIIFRPNIYNTHFAEVFYNHYYFNSEINIMNPKYSPDNNAPEFLTLHYRFKSDLRDDKPYPLSGYYFDIDFYKFGLWTRSNNPDIIFLHSTFNKYLRLSDRFYSALGLLAGSANTKDQPYYLSTGLGYGHDNLRGFDYYVINGQHYGIGKFNVKYELVKPKVYNIGFIPWEKFSRIHYAFYLNLFADGGYVYDDNYYKNNKLANQFLYSSGVGLDFVTYYDKVIRFEYTYNKLKESGLFINFIAPI